MATWVRCVPLSTTQLGELGGYLGFAFLPSAEQKVVLGSTISVDRASCGTLMG